MFGVPGNGLLQQWPIYVGLLAGLVTLSWSEDAPEGRLYDDLFMHYNPDVRPVVNASDVVSVKIGLSVVYVHDLDVEKGILDMVSWVNLEWTDPQLRWDPGAYGGMTVLNVPSDVTWVPDIVIANLLAPMDSLYSGKSVVSADGAVWRSGSYRTRTICPYDPDASRQECLLKFMSWTYDGFRVDLNVRDKNVDLSDYHPNKNWEITQTNITRRVNLYSCCPEPFPDVVVKIELSPRKDRATNHSPNSSRAYQANVFCLAFLSILCMSNLK